MPLDEEDAALLWDMLRHAQVATRLIAGLSEVQYMQDERTRFALERVIEIIGEAASDVSDNARQMLHVLPWEKIVAQRNVLAHDYGRIDHSRIWSVAKEHIPIMIDEIDRLLAQSPPRKERDSES